MNTIYGHKRDAYNVLVPARDVWRHLCGPTLDVDVITTCYFPYEKGTETFKTRTKILLGSPSGTSSTELQQLIAPCCLCYLQSLYQIHRLYDTVILNST
jgi:hypothetical protein